MTAPDPAADPEALDESTRPALKRRTFIGVGGGVGATLLAGCTSEIAPAGDPDDESDDGSQDGESGGGTFRFLISDLPADIGDFDSLDVSFETARVFERDDADDESGGDDGADDTDADEDDGGDANESDDADANEDDGGDAETEGDTDGDEAGEDEADEDDDAGDDDEASEDGARNWYELDLDGATVDLTQVVGDRAMGIFEGELSEGRYAKIELYVADVEGIVDGEIVDVKVPSEKLQLVKPFEVRADETLSFVFDINVVKKGHDGGYNLLPVIGESGVVGKDVEVEEIDRDDDGEEDGDDDSTSDAENGTSDAENGTSDDGDVVTGDHGDGGSDEDGA